MLLNNLSITLHYVTVVQSGLMYETPKPLCTRCAKLLKLETVRKELNVKKISFPIIRKTATYCLCSILYNLAQKCSK